MPEDAPLDYWTRLRRRKIVQWGIAYLAAAWVLLQLLSLLAQPFAWPALVLRAATVVLAIGFLAALVVAWYHGERGRQGVSSLELVMLTALLIIAGVAVALVSNGRPAESIKVADIDDASIAVLPFDDLSSAKDQAYFTDGITEEILNVLAKVNGLRVAARTSSFQFKDQDIDVREIGRRLGVAHVLEGSIQRAGDRVRITAQLIDARSGYHMWSDRWDREVKDVFAVEDEIAMKIADALEQRIRVAGAPRRATTPEAHDAYLRGKALLNIADEPSLRSSLEYFDRALQLDPNYAAAHTGIAFAYFNLADAYMRPLDAYPRGIAAASRALAIDSMQTTASAILAYGELVVKGAGERTRSLGMMRRAVELNPNSVEALFLFSNLLCATGAMAEGLAAVESALRLDPLSVILNWEKELCLAFAGRYDDLIAQHRRTRELAPGFVYLEDWAAFALRGQGKYEEALREYDHVRHPDYPLYGEAISLIKLNRNEEARALVRRMEARAATQYVSPSLIGLVYAHLGEIEKAKEWIRRSATERDVIGASMSNFKNPDFAPIWGNRELSAITASVRF